MFSVLDDTNSMCGKNTGLQRQIKFYSPFNIYINCRNHQLVLCLPHVMKDVAFAELLINTHSCLVFGKCSTFHQRKVQFKKTFNLFMAKGL